MQMIRGRGGSQLLRILVNGTKEESQTPRLWFALTQLQMCLGPSCGKLHHLTITSSLPYLHPFAT